MNYKRNLEKPIYDLEQLKRAIETNVTELKPAFPNVDTDLVLTEIYNEQLGINEELNENLANAINERERLQQEINEIRAEIEQLSIQMDESRNGKQTAMDQLVILSEEIRKLEVLLSEAIQKAIEYGIDKVSIAAQNDAIRVGIEMTEEEIEYLKGQLDIIGDTSKLNELLTNTKFDDDFNIPTTDPSSPFRGFPDTDEQEPFDINKVTITSSDSLSISASNRNVRPNIPFTVTIRNNNQSGIARVVVSHHGVSNNWRMWMVPVNPRFEIPPNGTEIVRFGAIGSIITSLTPSNSLSLRSPRNYDGELRISINDETIRKLPTRIRKSGR